MGFYARLRDRREDDEALQTCIEHVVDKLDQASDPNRPGMLLGKIQSGKTRAFLGVIARAFDRDFDIAIVLTKGTKTLASQTVKRIGRDFKPFIDNNEIVLFEIMSAPDPLTRAELHRKIIIVAKKQVHNLSRIQAMFDDKYPDWRNRRVLLVDDEADMASVRFAKKKGDSDYDQGTIANQMDELRRTVDRIAFLQVTATPYALYLQPEDYEAATNAKAVFEQEETPGVPGLDLPRLNPAAIAAGYGCRSVEARSVGEVADALSASFAHERPTVIAVPIDPMVPPLF